MHEEDGISARRMENRSIVADIHEVMGDIVVIRDMDRRIVEANAIFRDMTGCVAPEGRTCEEIGIAFRPGDRAHAYDVEIATPFGQRIFVWQDAVTRDIGSSRLLISSIARDVTEERFSSRDTRRCACPSGKGRCRQGEAACHCQPRNPSSLVGHSGHESPSFADKAEPGAAQLP